MAAAYLPASDTYVLKEDGETVGFITMVVLFWRHYSFTIQELDSLLYIQVSTSF